MKKTALCLMALGLSLTFHPLQSNATNAVVPASSVASNTTESAQAKTLLGRLNEINAMDKSSLDASQKKNLRIEVRSIRHQLKDIGGGVYVSAGALIIILILLIILL